MALEDPFVTSWNPDWVQERNKELFGSPPRDQPFSEMMLNQLGVRLPHNMKVYNLALGEEVPVEIKRGRENHASEFENLALLSTGEHTFYRTGSCTVGEVVNEVVNYNSSSVSSK